MFSPIRRGEETERIHVVNCFKRQFSNDGLQASQQNKSMAAPYGTEPAQETQLLIDSFFFYFNFSNDVSCEAQRNDSIRCTFWNRLISNLKRTVCIFSELNHSRDHFNTYFMQRVTEYVIS